MKGPFFNDVSIYPLCETDEEVETRVNGFVDILEFCGFLGFNKVGFSRYAGEIELKQGYNVKEYLSSYARGNQNRTLLLLNMMRPPYIEDGTVAEDRYITHTARLKNKDMLIEAEGLACAHYSGGFAVGFASDDLWRNSNSFMISVIDDATNKSHDYLVYCISCFDHFKDSNFIKWAVTSQPLQLRPSNLPVANKDVKLRDDHGKHELRQFSDLIKKEPYIIEVVNSLPFDPKSRRMTKIIENYLIEVRLLDTDNKIGILVRTTALSAVEASYMAADIEYKYS